MNLLIVNDVVPTLEFLSQKIRWPNYGIDSCFTADGAQQAREVLKERTVDVLLCDIQMPDENGLELTKWVLENGYDCECIFLTCYAKFEYAQEAIKLGCSDFILFPATPKQIGEAVAKIVVRREKQMESDRLRQFGQYWLDSVHAEKCDNVSRERSPQEVVDLAIKNIFDNISSPDLNVVTLSQMSCLSANYFSRLFKKNTGLSICQFIIRERMQLAARLLASTSTSVSNIALEAGYDNFPYFSISFKKCFGVSPTKYREEAHTQPVAIEGA